MRNAVMVVGATGDLGRNLLQAFNRRGQPTVALGRTNSVAVDLPNPDINHSVQVSDLDSGWPELATVLPCCTAIVNCAGRTIPSGVDQNPVDILSTNLGISLLVDFWAGEFKLPILQISTGLLDNLKSIDPHQLDIQAMDLAAAARSPQKLIADGRIMSIRAGAKTAAEAYLLAKSCQESLVTRREGAVAIRVSNFFGPDCQSPRLIPRLIEGRLRGIRRVYRNEFRNYSYVEDLAEFLRLCVERRSQLDASLVWAYGAHVVSVRKLSKAVTSLLPSCYGEILVQEPANPPEQPPSRPILSSYFPELVTPHRPIFDEQLAATVAAWRGHITYTAGDVVTDGISSDARRMAITGGSIAYKEIVAASQDDGTLVKTTEKLGYEGAGYPKLRSELMFYRSLAELESHRGLHPLYPELIDATVAEGMTRLVLRAHGDGRTAADSLVSDEPFPREEVYALVSRAFHLGYLSDLFAVSDRESRRLLGSLYLDRAAGRVRGFLKHLRDGELGPTERDLVDRVLGGEMLRIDGITCRNPLRALASIATTSCEDQVRPRALGLCSHGDMTVLNMLRDYPGGSLLLIDPRGVIGPWDPVYDLGKIAFSLSGFAHCMRGHLRWTSHGSQFRVLADDNSESYARGQRERGLFVSRLSADPDFSVLCAKEPYLLHRIAFAESVHYLADTPYRYAQGSDIQSALIVLLLGTKHLENCMREIERSNRSVGDGCR
ncbi:NAD-dependent epimerase/dehydratase family protein [Streptomyces sp. NPDC048415]|uniref:NAD-dependent epimerase/dehydratase family protein n=1 Tax=Streptomyces sp. NPDC048415 TaxID=3154822 RepID=UPI003445571E